MFWEHQMNSVCLFWNIIKIFYSKNKKLLQIFPQQYHVHVTWKKYYYSWGHFDFKVNNNETSKKDENQMCSVVYLLFGISPEVQSKSFSLFLLYLASCVCVWLRSMTLASLKTLNSQINSFCINRSGHKKVLKG